MPQQDLEAIGKNLETCNTLLVDIPSGGHKIKADIVCAFATDHRLISHSLYRHLVWMIWSKTMGELNLQLAKVPWYLSLVIILILTRRMVVEKRSVDYEIQDITNINHHHLNDDHLCYSNKVIDVYQQLGMGTNLFRSKPISNTAVDHLLFP